MVCQVVFENGEITKVYSPNGQESNLYNQILSRYQGNKEKALEKWVQLTTQKDTLRLEQLDSNGEPIVNDDLYLAEDISPIINFYKNEGDKSYSDSKAVFNRVLSRLKAEYPLLANRIRGRKVMSGGGYVYKFGLDNIYQQKSSVETRPSDEKLNKKIATLLEGIGIKTDYLKDSRYKDNSPLGIADMLNKVAYISMNRAKIDTLPEEAAHFFVDYLEQTSNPLFSSMMYDIGKYNTYMETYKEYQNTYLTNDGTPDINKIKKEAIGKMIAKIIVDKNNINESQNLIDRFVRWLNKVMDLIKEQLVRLGLSDEAKIEDYFELAATNILAGKYQGEFKPYDEIFLQQSDTQKKLDNIITERNSEIRTVKKTDEEESIKEIFEKGEWKRIKRVSDITKTKGKYYNNTDTRTEIEKTKNDNQKLFGDKIHNDLMILMNKALGKTDNRPFMLNSAYHEKMQNFVDSIISQFNPDTHQYYTEVNIHNKNLAGTIDLLIVDSEGKANLFDYKSITGLLDNVNIGTNYTDKWYEQLIQYRKILTDYGITKFGQTRVIPIAVNFSDKITAKEGSDLPSAFSIGTNTYIDVTELSNLNPVPLPEERTGNKSIDSMIDRINDRIRQLNAKPSQENTFKINELKKDIANLQVSKNLEVIAYQAETDLGIIENLLKKAEKESLNGDEIYDLIQLYIEDQLIMIENKDLGDKSQRKPNTKLIWTSSKVALTELIYALHSEGVFNNGAADLKDIAENFEHIFEIDLGQYRRTFLEIRARKNDKTKFITTLNDALLKRMENSDEVI